MTIYRGQPQQQQRGFLSSPTSFVYRGPWAGSTAYARADVIIDPFGVLRWCNVAHTSPATFAPGSEYSSGSPQWMKLPTNGAFRGLYTVSHNGSYATVYTPGDLVIDPNTAQVTRALYEDSAGSSWNATKFSDMGVQSPFALLDPGTVLPPVGMPNAKAPHALGLYPKKSRLMYPRAKPIWVPHAEADFTSVTSGTVTADPDPIDPNGCPLLTFNTGTGAIYTKQLPATVDIHNAIVRQPYKLTGSILAAKVAGKLGKALSTASAITTLPLELAGEGAGLWYGLAPGCKIILTEGANTQTFTVTEYVSASGSATQIPVESQKPNFAYPIGTEIKTLDRTKVKSVDLQVSSDNFATTASHAFLNNTTSSPPIQKQLAADAWTWAGTGPAGWATVAGKSAATMTAINAVRLVLIGLSGVTNTLSVSKLEVLPNNGETGSKGDGRAKCVLWFDDSYEGHWTYVLAEMLKYGFPGVSASQGSVDTAASPSSFTYAQLQYLAHFHGWQHATHYYYANDGGDDQTKDGPAKDAYIMRSRHSLQGAGAWGQDHHAWHDDDTPTAQNLPITRKNFASVRGYDQGLGVVQTLPPVSPDYVDAWGIQTADNTGATVAKLGSALTTGGPITALPLEAGGLSVDVAVGEQIILTEGEHTQTFIVRTYIASGAGVTEIPVESQTPNFAYAAKLAILNPASAMKAFVKETYAHAGLCQFVWENVSSLTGNPAFTNLLCFLDAQRANIDVVTIAEALSPWTISA